MARWKSSWQIGNPAITLVMKAGSMASLERCYLLVCFRTALEIISAQSLWQNFVTVPIIFTLTDMNRIKQVEHIFYYNLVVPLI